MNATVIRLINAARAFIDAYGGNILDWLETEYSELEDALQEIERERDKCREATSDLCRQCWEFYDVGPGASLEVRWIVASNYRNAIERARQRGWKLAPDSRVVEVNVGKPEFTDKQWRDCGVDVVLK